MLDSIRLLLLLFSIQMVKAGKSKGIKMGLGEFLNPGPAGSTSWADDEPDPSMFLIESVISIVRSMRSTRFFSLNFKLNYPCSYNVVDDYDRYERPSSGMGQYNHRPAPHMTMSQETPVCLSICTTYHKLKLWTSTLSCLDNTWINEMFEMNKCWSSF